MSDPVQQRPTRIEIDLDAFAHNHAAIRAHVGVPVMGIVKANGYGHGLVPMARQLEKQGVEQIGVAFVEEGVALRRAGIRTPILVLGGIFGPQVGQYLDHDLEITVSSLDKLRQVEALGTPLSSRMRSTVQPPISMRRTEGSFWISSGWIAMAEYPCGNSFTSSMVIL